MRFTFMEYTFMEPYPKNYDPMKFSLELLYNHLNNSNETKREKAQTYFRRKIKNHYCYVSEWF